MRKEGVAHLVSLLVWRGIDGQGWWDPRLAQVTGKIGIDKYACICVYALVNDESRKGECRL